METKKLDESVADLIARLRAALGEEIVAVILYGSAAVGDYHAQTSDLNILCVLRQVTPHELVQSEPVFRWWREQGNPPPLLMSDEEVRRSTDSFPMEFHDMQEHRKVLFGIDVIENLEIDRSFYRAQVEHELRAKQLRLRQKAAEVLSDSARLLRLMTDSVSTFCVLGRHALLLSGHEGRWKKAEIVESLTEAIPLPMPATNEILAIRAAPKQKTSFDAAGLFSRYLKEIDALVRFVDGLEK